tara:strand:- start:3133 stop:3279 length:147 start_codon:yes stop_codon:yes gene_type:complete
MADRNAGFVITLNRGSLSLKFALYKAGSRLPSCADSLTDFGDPALHST